MFWGSAIVVERTQISSLQISGWLFTVGVIFFSGSLYGLIFTGQNFFGPITPLGGLLLIIGWFWWVIAVLKSH